VVRQERKAKPLKPMVWAHRISVFSLQLRKQLVWLQIIVVFPTSNYRLKCKRKTPLAHQTQDAVNITNSKARFFKWKINASIS
jgi:hypothetical protein